MKSYKFPLYCISASNFYFWTFLVSVKWICTLVHPMWISTYAGPLYIWIEWRLMTWLIRNPYFSHVTLYKNKKSKCRTKVVFFLLYFCTPFFCHGYIPWFHMLLKCSTGLAGNEEQMNNTIKKKSVSQLMYIYIYIYIVKPLEYKLFCILTLNLYLDNVILL